MVEMELATGLSRLNTSNKNSEKERIASVKTLLQSDLSFFKNCFDI